MLPFQQWSRIRSCSDIAIFALCKFAPYLKDRKVFRLPISRLRSYREKIGSFPPTLIARLSSTHLPIPGPVHSLQERFSIECSCLLSCNIVVGKPLEARIVFTFPTPTEAAKEVVCHIFQPIYDSTWHCLGFRASTAVRICRIMVLAKSKPLPRTQRRNAGLTRWMAPLVAFVGYFQKHEPLSSMILSSRSSDRISQRGNLVHPIIQLSR